MTSDDIKRKMREKYQNDENYRRERIEAGKLWYQNNKELVQLRYRQHKENDLARWLLNKARTRAKNSSIEFNLQCDDINVPKVCPILGIELSLGSKRFHAGSPTLDRIDPEIGYVKGNVQVISHRANSLKSNATLQELVLLGEWAKSTLELRRYLAKL